MRSAAVDTSRLVLALVAIASLGVAACIIGPKQDDPETLGVADSGVSDTNATTPLDAADQFDGSKFGPDGGQADSGTPMTIDAAGDGCVKPDADGGDARCTDAMSDVASDVAEGG